MDDSLERHEEVNQGLASDLPMGAVQEICAMCDAPLEDQDMEILERMWGDAEDDNQGGDDFVAEPVYERFKRRKEGLQKEARSISHLMNHEPKNPFCRFCNRGKVKRRRRLRIKNQKKKDFAKLMREIR